MLSRVRLLATPRTVAHQVPPFMGFSRQEYWNGVPLPSPVSLISSHFFLFLFVLLWETDLSRHCYNLCQRMFCLCSLLGVLWYHVLKVFKPFEFLCRVWRCILTSLIYMQLSHFPSTICWRDCLPILYSCLICQRLIEYRCVVYFWAIPSILLIHIICFCANTTLFWLL